ncbi:response regulator [Christiangramia sp. SM2212]|uniref:Response regulator n=1 Tax=Christiangramia sediminicola TaxID=3073267 RepID=A0ABU1EMD1_9FLAO|nr:response regulator [Christiangramia sp. SM2212]MDR5589545.1 response regulator [Christiangramia sp. SM2212]
MFKKVLIAEDMDTVNHAVTSVLKDLKIENSDHVQYCDNAYILAKKALNENTPYDLLICDLSFKKDHREESITSGQELIRILKEEDPNLKVLVNSIEDSPLTVNKLWESGNINAYVCKDRNGMSSLKKAIEAIHRNRKYNSPGIEEKLNKSNTFTLNDFEISLLDCLAKGMTQDQIQEHYKTNNIKPSSKSSIEKRLKELKEEFQANTTAHLIGIVKDLRLI